MRPAAGTPHARALAECVAGATALHAGRTDAALRRYATAVALAPSAADIAALHGVALRDAGRMQDAQREFIRAISLDATRADSFTQLAQTYHLIGDHAQSAQAFLAAATLKEGDAYAWRDTAEAMRHAQRLPDGLAIARHAFALAPRDASCANTLALLLHRNGLIDDAMTICGQVRAIDPHDRNLSLTHAMLLRTCGHYDDGWALHERRLELPELTQRPFPPASPRWDGRALRGEHLLVRGEQGLGDQVQFVRWVHELRCAGASRITVQCGAPLVRLLEGMRGIDAVVPNTAAAPPHDLHAEVMSLPHLLRTGDDMQRSLVPYLAAPALPNATLAARLERTRPGALRIALVWGGTPLHTEDRSRSMPLATLLPALVRPDVELVIVQQGSPREQLAAVGATLRSTFVDVAGDCRDMADTAQVLAACDLLLSVDTSVAHVAGAMGLPTWVMVAHPAEWRWGRTRADCLFYPSVRVLRQEAVGDWSAVVRAIAGGIDAHHAGRAT
ncbi:MAG TPA: glycosyltransferase family 9 protein [Gemmatimonadaceae bacterium]|nr:glycosyltransferase family 9 protein [Gemmatimonadaceae bacterium]